MGVMDGLRLAMNRSLFLGLEVSKATFEMCLPGAFYLRHVDRFRDARPAVSAVIYLNDAWLPGTWRPNRMYLKGGVEYDVVTFHRGRLVVFSFGEVPHEVPPCSVNACP